jgi:hypothetical protein
MSAPSQNLRESTIASILGSVSSTATAYGTQAAAYTSSAYTSYATPEVGSYTLNVFFYIFMYMFLLFIVLLIVHFSIRPVFRFTPGAKGIIGLPAATDDKVYWTGKKQPNSDELGRAPLLADSLAAYRFDTDFSFSVDLFVRRITDADSGKNRVILYKTFEYGSDVKTQISGTPGTGATGEIYALPSFTTGSLEEYMQTRCSMYMYLNDTNDLGVTFFSGALGTPYSIREVKNIPLYTPFRVTVVAQGRTFTVYLNGKQTFQRIVPTSIALNSMGGMMTSNQRFYAPPLWAKAPSQTFFVQNLHIWPRAISYTEVTTAQPALALESDFGMSGEVGTTKCS